MEDTRQNFAPFILKPIRINNYTHLIALLKRRKTREEAFEENIVCEANLFSQVRESFLSMSLDSEDGEVISESLNDLVNKRYSRNSIECIRVFFTTMGLISLSIIF
jgi:hypothetical protein